MLQPTIGIYRGAIREVESCNDRTCVWSLSTHHFGPISEAISDILLEFKTNARLQILISIYFMGVAKHLLKSKCSIILLNFHRKFLKTNTKCHFSSSYILGTTKLPFPFKPLTLGIALFFAVFVCLHYASYTIFSEEECIVIIELI